jgi:hypothetical protein
VTNNTGGPATLYGWIDYDADGAFENATERASIAVPDGSTDLTVTLTFPVVPAGFLGDTYARFRLSTDGAAAEPTGPATDGEVEDYTAVIDQAPQVTGVWVRGSAWATTLLDYLEASGQGHATYGYAIPVGSADQLLTLPWFNLDRISIAFSEDVVVQESDLALWGVTVSPQYGFADTGGFSYDSTAHVATWTLDEAIGQPDKLRIDLDGEAGAGVIDTAGNLLDGDWTDGGQSYPSGDGTPGGDFCFRFNVLPGDADQSGQVRTLDWRNIRLQLGAAPVDPNYSVLYDVDGSGRIRTLDWRNARLRLGDQLPTGDPGPPLPPPASLGLPGAVPFGDPALAPVVDGSFQDPAVAPVVDGRFDRLAALDDRTSRSLWDEALLLWAEELDDGDDEPEPFPDPLLPVLFWDFPRD